MLEKTYDAAAVEPRIYEAWEKAGAFKAGAGAKPGAKPFSIVIPPPNVTGSLHMGHALNNTIQDILVRFERMRGRDVLWQPGTDHAGIATQMVVERQMMERQEPDRREIGREKFLEKVWAWKAESGGQIINQLKRLGCVGRLEPRTLHHGRGAVARSAVIRSSSSSTKQGLIYKDKRLVNWDPKLQTAISDLEVQQVETKGKLWHFRYPIEGKDFNPADPSTFIVVATTRPETMLGDTGVAVHPDDERYKDLVGKNAILPLVGRKIPIIADEYSDPEKGSGAVKITPGARLQRFRGRQAPRPGTDQHLFNIKSQNDRQRQRGVPGGSRQRPREAQAKETIAAVDGQDRFAARKKIVERLEEKGLLDKIEPTHTRCRTATARTW